MFNWLFGKKKEATTNVVLEIEVLDNPVVEEVVEETPNIIKLFEAFPTLKKLCEIQFEMDQRIYVTSSGNTGLIAPKFTDVSYYKKLVELPEISKVMSNDCHHNGDKLYSYLSVSNEYVTILKSEDFRCEPRLYFSIKKINPPVMRVVENLSNNTDSWDIMVNVVTHHEDESETMGFTEACIKSLRTDGLGYPESFGSFRTVKKYLIKGDIEISISEKTLKVKSDKINLSKGEAELLKEISADYEHKLIKHAKLEFEKEENQKRAAMDQVVAELFKGE